MTESGRQRSGLTYGHLGVSSYSQSENAWSFTRHIGGHEPQEPNSASFFSFEHVSSRRCVPIQNRADNSGEQPFSNLGTIQDFPKRCPETLPSSQVIGDVETTSFRSIRKDRVNYDVGDTFAFGTALRVDHSDRERRPLPIAAFAAGHRGESLHIAMLKPRNILVPDENGDELAVKVPSLILENVGRWQASAQRIRQIVSSHSSGIVEAWLAVRQDSSTTVFQPLFFQSKLALQETVDASKSQLEPNPIFTIPMSRTGGYPHADVAFHPESKHSLAIVDAHGHWSTWHLTGYQRRKARFQVQLNSSGRLHNWNEHYQPQNQRPHHDGWHSIQWIRRSDNTWGLVIADRRKICVFDVNGIELYEAFVDLGPVSQGHWILDIKSILNGRAVVILTSTQILHLCWKSYISDNAQETGKFTLQTFWRHFRASSDTTLKLCTLASSIGKPTKMRF